MPRARLMLFVFVLGSSWNLSPAVLMTHPASGDILKVQLLSYTEYGPRGLMASFSYTDQPRCIPVSTAGSIEHPCSWRTASDRHIIYS